MNAARNQHQKANVTLRGLCALLRGLMTPAEQREFKEFERRLHGAGADRNDNGNSAGEMENER